MDGRLSSAQTLLQQHEEAGRRGERERRALADRAKELERALQALETDKKHMQVHTHTHTHTHEHTRTHIHTHTCFDS